MAEPDLLISSEVWLRLLPFVEAEQLLRGERAVAVGLRWHPEYPMSDSLTAIAMLAEAHRVQGWAGREVPTWWICQIVMGDEVVGDCGFHGPPGDRAAVVVEVGYNVVSGMRGRGVATRACRLLLERAWRDGADAVRARTDLDNVASQQVLVNNGFTTSAPGEFLILRPDRLARGAP